MGKRGMKTKGGKVTPLTQEELRLRRDEHYSKNQNGILSGYMSLIIWIIDHFTSFQLMNSDFLQIVAIVCVFVVGYLVSSWIKYYRLAKDIQAVINVLNVRPTVGQTVTCQIRFRRKMGRILTCSSTLFQDLQEHIKITIEGENVTTSVGVIQEVNTVNSSVLAKFSIRQAGFYEIIVKYHGFRITPEQTLRFEVYPGMPSLKMIDFGTHNPHVLCLTAGIQQSFKILAEDQYGNSCHTKDLDLSNFSFQLQAVHTKVVDAEYEFSRQVVNDSESACLKMKLVEPGIYPCTLKYNDQVVPGCCSGVHKLLVCISPEEEAELRCKFSRQTLPGVFLYSCSCMVSFVGESDNFESFQTGVSANYLALASHTLALVLYPHERFPINGKTKITFHGSRHSNNETEVITFLVQDGLRQSVLLETDPESARMLLVTFAHNQGFTLPKLHNTFLEKKLIMQRQLSSYFTGFWFSAEVVLNIDSGSLIESTLREVPKTSDDWLLPFRINFNDCSPQSTKTSRKSRVTEWLNRLCEEFFTKYGDNGMFHTLPGSKLLHPAPASQSRKPLAMYRLAGEILGKSIVEALLRKVCTRMSNVRFTRSFLAFILGYPMQFKESANTYSYFTCLLFLEADEPSFFGQVKEILETDVTDKGYTFTSLSPAASQTKSKNLAPNGSNLPVTNENKEHYLNLLTYHRLIHTVEQEIMAFREGFHNVINRDTLCDFRESDLQMLTSGGCDFSMNDLKENHRVVHEVDNGFVHTTRRQSIDKNKVLNWFWTAVQNMSEKEQSYLIFFATGSFSLPACGLADLSPPFTINLTGTFNQPPVGHPISNEIVLGDHVSFESFERSLLYAITPGAERISVVPGETQDLLQLQLQNDLQDLSHDSVGQNDEMGPDEQIQQEPQHDDPLWNYLRGQLRRIIGTQLYVVTLQG